MDSWREYAPLVLRLVTGIIFAVHGWQKYQSGIPAIAGFVGSIGFPMPEVFAVLLIAAELIGGLFLIIGLLTRWAAKSLIIVSLVALVLVHLPNGFSLATGGYEYILLLLAASVSLALSGPGKWALDHVVWKNL